MEKVTIKKLAEELNLSASTISRALQDSYQIGSKTKRRVLELAAELNYVPNYHASGLRKKVSKTIAVVIPEVADSFFAQAINGIEAVAQESGFHVLIYLTHESCTKEQAILKDFQNGRVDGVLLSITAETAQYNYIQELISRGIPLVLFDRVCEEIATAKIITNDFESSYQATQHLISCGCRRIALLSASNSLAISKNRLAGYKQALIDLDIDFKEDFELACSKQDEVNYQLIKELLTRPDRTDGIVATVEKQATIIYQVCRELNLQIPQHLKVVSFSNLQTAAYLNPALTTVTQPAFDMGKAAATSLFKALKGKNVSLISESQVLPSVLHIRESTCFH
ncbi:LacI family DNA-binding transcriptional regulator [Adhaeribacter radiodurans]|uniref:LacI family DNA-binding transcriptional regulator n=1 Tax=Adhaeribacter radiodurans TaxID=2745197 RepID=A0A7L7L3G8_9BACT|nr:LacI family DNA-binding transcriptional regulator [Adhaeribacter radiodurans]QMU27324.1 LacI family DNA-binding transcriptional regulator [Adhaeribacter radiodurans]